MKRRLVQAALLSHPAGKRKRVRTQSFAKQPHIFCDLDGVLVDFNAGVQKLFRHKVNVKELPSNILWKSISRAPNFFRNLPWTPDGQELWEAIRPLKPDILTGVSMGKSVAFEKFQWCQFELCVECLHVHMAAPKQGHELLNPGETRRSDVTNVITCWTRNKHFESGPGRILIDDRQELQENWEAAGGVFVHHTSTQSTLQVLKEIGVLSRSDDGDGGSSDAEKLGKDKENSSETKEEVFDTSFTGDRNEVKATTSADSAVELASSEHMLES